MATQNMSRALTHSLIIFSFLFALCSGARYTPDWKSLDTRPLPAWFDQAKFGISVHWGLYSVPSFGKYHSEDFWGNWKKRKYTSVVNFMNHNYKPGFAYKDFAPQFTAELFDPDQWADLFFRSGARYVILTAKHLDGFTLWPSNFSLNWNAMDVGPHRDLVGDLSSAVRRKGGMRFGVEHSKMDRFHPYYIADKESGWATSYFPRAKSTPELTELVERYHPDIIWSQGDNEAPHTYWNSTSFLAWLYNESPVHSDVVVNDRWGRDARGLHGDILNCDLKCGEKVFMRSKWLNPVSICKNSWGYRREAQISDFRTVPEIIEELVITISRNGSLLLGVSATKDGVIPQLFQERLADVGKWLEVNGEGVYGSTPWKHQKDAVNPNIRYTAKGNTVYVFMLRWPKNRLLYLQSLNVWSEGQITILGLPKERLVQFTAALTGGTTISLPPLTPDELPTPWALVLKVEGAL